MHSRSLSQTSARSIRSASSECEGTPHPWIATMFYPDGVNGGKRKGRAATSPGPFSNLYSPKCPKGTFCLNIFPFACPPIQHIASYVRSAASWYADL
jgi:hypothetical protein